MVKEHPLLKGVAYVLLSICIWSGWMVVSRYGVKGTLSSYDITAIRFGVAGMILLPVALRRGLSVGPYGIAGGMLLAIMIGAPYTNLAIAGMKYAPASHASTVINGTLLVLTTIVGIKILREPTSPLRLIGVACSLLGIICMLTAKSTSSSADQWFGHLLFVISGFMWGTYTLLVRAWKVDAMHTAAAVCVFSMVGYLPLYLLFAQSHIGLANWHEVAFQSFYQGLLTGVIALVSFNTGIRILGASHAGTFIPLVPVLSTLLAIPILHEVPSLLEWSGVAAVSTGVFLASGALNWRPWARKQCAGETG